MNPTIELMRSHRSIRRYTDTPVEQSLVETIVQAAQSASTSHFVQAYTIIQVSDPDVRQAMAELAGNQVWVISAPVFLVFCADQNRLDAACHRHGTSMTRGYAEQFVTLTVDTALVAQNVMLAAESAGLGGVFVGGIRNDPSRVCDLLGIPENAYPVFGMCLGYPADDPGIKPRLPLQAVLKQDRYSVREEAALLETYDLKVEAYYRSRTSGARSETWTGQMASFMSRITRPHMKPFLEKCGFFLR